MRLAIGTCVGPHDVTLRVNSEGAGVDRARKINRAEITLAEEKAVDLAWLKWPWAPC